MQWKDIAFFGGVAIPFGQILVVTTHGIQCMMSQNGSTKQHRSEINIIKKT